MHSAEGLNPKALGSGQGVVPECVEGEEAIANNL